MQRHGARLLQLAVIDKSRARASFFGPMLPVGGVCVPFDSETALEFCSIQRADRKPLNSNAFNESSQSTRYSVHTLCLCDEHTGGFHHSPVTTHQSRHRGVA